MLTLEKNPKKVLLLLNKVFRVNIINVCKYMY